jgi:hypothetical protein
MSNYKVHIQRKTPCKPEVSEVVPMLDNVQIVRQVTGGNNVTVIVVDNSAPATVSVDNSTHIDNSTHVDNSRMLTHTTTRKFTQMSRKISSLSLVRKTSPLSLQRC